jgi:glucose/mannose-6-phosphate isomerase
MNLDDRALYSKLDPQDMLAAIRGLPDQLALAWTLGINQELQLDAGINRVVIAGMGGSAIGGDLVATCVRDRVKVPVIVHRNYGLPGWAHGPDTLLIASSHSGNTEETLSVFEAALHCDCRRMVITTGGRLAEMAAETGTPLWKFEHRGQPRAAVGFSFGLLLAALSRSGLIDDLAGEVQAAVDAMRHQMTVIDADVPVVKNPAKRLAGQLVDRYVAVFGADYLEPVARRWKTQINEISKAWAQFEFLPEADHNTLAGVVNPPDLLNKVVALFLQGASDHERNRLRADLTRQGMMTEGIGTDFFRAPGELPIEQMWAALHFGDYLSYYLAMAYQVDPTPVEAIEGLKRAMKA